MASTTDEIMPLIVRLLNYFSKIVDEDKGKKKPTDSITPSPKGSAIKGADKNTAAQQKVFFDGLKKNVLSDFFSKTFYEKRVAASFNTIFSKYFTPGGMQELFSTYFGPNGVQEKINKKEKKEKKGKKKIGVLGNITDILQGKGLSEIIQSLSENVKSSLMTVTGSIGDAFSSFSGKAIVGTLAFAGVCATLNYTIIPALEKLADIKWDDIQEGIAALGVVIGGLSGIVLLLGSNKIKSLIGVTALIGISFSLGLLAENLMKLVPIKWNEIKGGLAAAGVALGGLTLVVGIISGLIIGTGGMGILGVIAGIGSVIAMSYSLGILAEKIEKFALFKWDDVISGLAAAGVAITGMTAVVGLLGGLIVGTGGIGAIVAGVGLAAVYGLASAIGEIATQLQKYNNVNVDKLKQISEILPVLGIGLLGMMGINAGNATIGIISNTIDRFASWFKLDIVSEIKKYESLDSKKLTAASNTVYKLGKGIESLLKTNDGIPSLEASINRINSININDGPTSFLGYLDRIYNKTLQIKDSLDMDKLPAFKLLMGKDSSFEVALKNNLSEGFDETNKILSKQLSVQQDLLAVTQESHKLLAQIPNMENSSPIKSMQMGGLIPSDTQGAHGSPFNTRTQYENSPYYYA